MIINNLKKRFYTSLILFFILTLIFIFDSVQIYFLILLGVLSILEFLKLTRNIFKKKINQIMINLFFVIYISLFCLIFFFFSGFIQLKIILYTLLLGCIASDIGGFIFGKIFRGPKLSKISPSKTYSGSFGSIALCTFVVSLLFFNYMQVFNIKIILVGIITSIFCQIGDLFFSYLKRRAKVKDTGNFLPGHGGILDRLDGIFLGIPFGFITLILFNN